MNKENKWIVWVAAIAAVVAAVTTVAIILLRARQKALCGSSDMICDCDCDCDCEPIACDCEAADECAEDEATAQTDDTQE